MLEILLTGFAGDATATTEATECLSRSTATPAIVTLLRQPLIGSDRFQYRSLLLWLAAPGRILAQQPPPELEVGEPQRQQLLAERNRLWEKTNNIGRPHDQLGAGTG